MSATEYLPSQDEKTNGQSNGHHTGNGKIFSLKPATDPDTYKILDARRDCLKDGRLNTSCKAFFCEVLDRSLNPSFFEAKGIVVISDAFLADVFSVSVRTIYTWKKAVAAAGFFWLADQFRTNMWPITKYYLTCLHRQRQEQKTDREGTYSTGGSYRPRPMNPGLGARRPGQPDLPLPGSRTAPPESENPVLQGISGQSGNKLPVRAEEFCGSEPKNSSGESRNIFRARAEADCGSEPKNSSGESRSILPVRAEADFQHIESQIRDSEPLESRGGDNPPDLAFEKWLKALDRMLPSQWEKLRAQFRTDYARTKGEKAKASLRAKIAAVQERLYGPPEPQGDDSLESHSKPPSIVSTIAAREATPEEIAAGEAFLAERKKRKVTA